MEPNNNVMTQLVQILQETVDMSRPLEPQIQNVLKALASDPQVMKSELGQMLQQADPAELIPMLAEHLQGGGNAQMEEEAPMDEADQMEEEDMGQIGYQPAQPPQDMEGMEGEMSEDEEMEEEMPQQQMKKGGRSQYIKPKYSSGGRMK